jgi:hypothetical protein
MRLADVPDLRVMPELGIKLPGRPVRRKVGDCTGMKAVLQTAVTSSLSSTIINITIHASKLFARYMPAE